MNDLDIPILKKTADLYKIFHEYGRSVSKQDRFTIYERSENLLLDMTEALLSAGYAGRANKINALEVASAKLNVLRFFIRLMKEMRTIDSKRYVILQEHVDEIGRMLGGWLRASTK
jgi:hypothetical protein